MFDVKGKGHSIVNSPYVSFGLIDRSLLTTSNTVFRKETEPI